MNVIIYYRTSISCALISDKWREMIIMTKTFQKVFA